MLSQLNLLIATKVGEEGLDIQTCCLVIRFDLPETVASFIQSRGRARMPHSEYAFLVDRYFSKGYCSNLGSSSSSFFFLEFFFLRIFIFILFYFCYSGNQKDLDLIENFKINERQMNFEIARRTTNEKFNDLEERVYKVDSSGASISSGYSISLLHQYCSKLPHDE